MKVIYYFVAREFKSQKFKADNEKADWIYLSFMHSDLASNELFLLI